MAVQIMVSGKEKSRSHLFTFPALEADLNEALAKQAPVAKFLRTFAKQLVKQMSPHRSSDGKLHDIIGVSFISLNVMLLLDPETAGVERLGAKLMGEENNDSDAEA